MPGGGADRVRNDVLEHALSFGGADLADDIPRIDVKPIGTLGPKPARGNRGDPFENVRIGNGNLSEQIEGIEAGSGRGRASAGHAVRMREALEDGLAVWQATDNLD